MRPGRRGDGGPVPAGKCTWSGKELIALNDPTLYRLADSFSHGDFVIMLAVPVTSRCFAGRAFCFARAPPGGFTLNQHLKLTEGRDWTSRYREIRDSADLELCSQRGVV